jgi:hypothetical protein
MGLPDEPTERADNKRMTYGQGSNRKQEVVNIKEEINRLRPMLYPVDKVVKHFKEFEMMDKKGQKKNANQVAYGKVKDKEGYTENAIFDGLQKLSTIREAVTFELQSQPEFTRNESDSQVKLMISNAQSEELTMKRGDSY